MRSGRPDGLSVPQFRLLRYVGQHSGTSLSAVADHLGASVPATSEQVERLVRGGFVTRTQCATERRRVELRLTPAGQTSVTEAEERTRAWLCDRLQLRSDGDLDELVQALAILRSLLAEPLPDDS